MAVAYLIRAHHRPQQLVRLVERLSSPQSSFHVFVSSRAPKPVYAAMREGLAGVDRVRWVERLPVYYSGFSLVRSIFAGLADIAAAGPIPGHVVLLSGQDYPLRRATEIEALLARRGGETLLEHFPIPSYDRWPDDDGGLDRIRYRYYERIRFRTRLLRLPFPKRSFPAGLEPHGGSAWGVLSADAARAVLAFPDERPDVFRYFEHVKTPDEAFLQTVLLNSPLRDRVANEGVHHIEWPGGSHPRTFTSADFDRLAASGKPFARKFDAETDAEILDRIDRELLLPKDEPAVTG